MPSFLSGEAEKLHGIGVKIPALAIAFEGKIVASSRRYLESLWKIKIEQMTRKAGKEYFENPGYLGIDLLTKAALQKYDLDHPQIESFKSTKDYLKSRNLYVESTLPNSLELVDYLDYDDLLDYLHFFTQNKIDSAVEYGRSLAKDSHGKTRMDGTPLPRYPPLVKAQRIPTVEVDLLKNADVKEDKKEKSESKRPRNVF